MSSDLAHHSEIKDDVKMFEHLDKDDGPVTAGPTYTNMDLESHHYKSLTKRVVRKFDIWVLPICSAIYIVAQLDKGNLGNAKILGLIKDFGGDPTGSKYALLNGSYFIGYVAFLIPGSLIGKRFRTNIVMGVGAVFWGAAAALTAATTTFGAATGTRLLIGVGEAGFGPVIPFYIARWYMRKELAFRLAIWQCTAQLSGVINGLISFGLEEKTYSIQPWKLLYIIEGSATFALGLLSLLILPSKPSTTNILTEEERKFAIARKAVEAGSDTVEIKWRHVWESFYDLRLILPTITYGISIFTGAVVGAFLPTLILELGYTGAQAQVLTLPCYLSAMLMILVTSRLADFFRCRAMFVVVGYLFEILGFGILMGTDPTAHAARYAGLVFTQIGVSIPIPLHLTWVAENAGNETKRACHIGIMVAVAQALAIASGYVFPASQAPKYTKGTAICLSLAILGLPVCVLHWYLLKRENKRRDIAEGPLTGITMETGELAEKAVGFRFMPG